MTERGQKGERKGGKYILKYFYKTVQFQDVCITIYQLTSGRGSGSLRR